VKLTGSRTEAFLRRPDPGIGTVLLFGPEQGLVEERARQLIRAAIGPDNDPFRLSEMPVETLKSDPSRLLDEALSLPFTGGRRVVRVRGATDVCTAAVRALLEAGAPGFVLLEAGELGPRSTLRQLVEAASAAAALGCYPDNEKSVADLARARLSAASISISTDALQVLIALLGSNRMATRSELDKLVDYIGDAGRVGVEDVLAVVGDTSAVSLEAVVLAAAEGNVRGLDRALTAAFAEGEQPIVMLRAAARHMLRLSQARAEMAARGVSARQAMEMLRPAVIFHLQARFTTMLQCWDRSRLATALLILAEAELASKRTGEPQHGLCCQALLRIAALASGSAAVASV